MLDLESVNILTYSRRGSGENIIHSILEMYDLSGLNYKIWTPYRNGSLSSLFKNSVIYSERDQEYYLTSGNLFRLDILVFELPTTNHPIYIEQNLKHIRRFFDGTIIFVGEDYKSITDELYHQKDIYPTYHIHQKIGSLSKGKLTNLQDLLKRNEWFIEDNNGDSQSFEDWKKSFIRDKKLKDILGD